MVVVEEEEEVVVGFKPESFVTLGDTFVEFDPPLPGSEGFNPPVAPGRGPVGGLGVILLPLEAPTVAGEALAPVPLPETAPEEVAGEEVVEVELVAEGAAGDAE